MGGQCCRYRSGQQRVDAQIAEDVHHPAGVDHPQRDRMRFGRQVDKSASARIAAKDCR